MKSQIKLMIVLMLLTALGFNQAQAQGGDGPAPVSTDFVQSGSVGQPIRLTGTVEAYRFSVLAAEEEGVVEQLYVEEGDYASTGTVLLRVRSLPLKLNYERAKAQASADKATLDELLNGSRPEDVQIARSEVDRIEAQLSVAKREFNRLENLYNDGTSSQSEFDVAKERYDRLQAERDAAKATFERTVHGPRVEEIARARAVYESSKADESHALDRFQRTSITAPYEGFVTAKHVEVGSWVGTGDAVLDYQSSGAVYVRVNIPEVFFNQITFGDPIDLEFDAAPNQLIRGTIAEIIPRADRQSRAFPVKILVDNKDGLLAPGMLGRASIAPRLNEPTVIVHKDAIVVQGGAIVFKVDRSGEVPVARRLEVRPGRYFGQAVEVSGDLKPGDEIVVRGNERLREGQELKLNQFLTNPDQARLGF